MKKLLLFLLIIPLISFSQSEEKKIELTVVKKPPNTVLVDYSKIGKDFTDMVNNILKDREERKAQLSNITQLAKRKIIENTQLGYSVDLNELILKTQQEANNRIDVNYRLLTKGLTNPDSYPSSIETLTNNYFNCMSIFQNIDLFIQKKVNSYLSNNEADKIDKLESTIKNTISKTTANYWADSYTNGRYSYESNQRFIFYLNGDFYKQDEKMEINQLYSYIVRKIN